VVVFAAMWPIALNTAAAVRALHPILLDSARALHLAPAARVRKVYAPALVPGLLLGVRVAAPVCLIVTLLVEMLTGATGVGALLLQAQRNFVSEQAFGLLIVVGVLGFAVNAGVRLVERSVLTRWPPRAGSR
jgi:ABC-type nitrate/sulfonate/bicarbonate transport system permease component